MVRIAMEDFDNCIILTEGYLPSLQEQKTAFPQAAPFFRHFKPEFDSLEQSAAWVISARARQYAYHRAGHYGGIQNVMAIPFNTWTIGPSQNGKLADWFEGKRDTQERAYRLIVKRMPRRFNDFILKEGPFSTYSSSQANAEGHLFIIRHRRGKFAPLKPSGQTFLKELLSAYSVKQEQIYFSGIGHPYWFSQGLPQKDW